MFTPQLSLPVKASPVCENWFYEYDRNSLSLLLILLASLLSASCKSYLSDCYLLPGNAGGSQTWSSISCLGSEYWSEFLAKANNLMHGGSIILSKPHLPPVSLLILGWSDNTQGGAACYCWGKCQVSPRLASCEQWVTSLHSPETMTIDPMWGIRCCSQSQWPHGSWKLSSDIFKQRNILFSVSLQRMWQFPWWSAGIILITDFSWGQFILLDYLTNRPFCAPAWFQSPLEIVLSVTPSVQIS